MTQIKKSLYQKDMLKKGLLRYIFLLTTGDASYKKTVQYNSI